MSRQYEVFLVAPNSALDGVRSARVRFRDALGLRLAVAPYGAEEQKAPDARSFGGLKAFPGQGEVVLELPQCAADGVHHRTRTGAGCGNAFLVGRIPLEVLAQGVSVKAHLQTQKRPAYDTVWCALRAEQRTEGAAYGTVRAEDRDFAGDAHRFQATCPASAPQAALFDALGKAAS